MGLTNAGLNRIRDVVNTDLTDGIAGTATTLFVNTQTALVNPVADTEVNVTTQVSNFSIQVTHLISSAKGNSSTLTEYANRMNSDTTMLSRVVLSGIAKTSDKELTKITTYNFLEG